ncbi:hypothetical protein IscW_ISCW003415 [Ixodes scapularis]|uniref:Secreted protein n=1 Tax=Ixodes scapularis TaxID=6945 RepID=B7PDB5_IXOSC|nr:hypothetical protein IscW_ISCW003415 [Ixodes scapularis]|eukprot:XP_002410715.1 hypothetical protein IscW_ISCW003415 [Ixodes scapularis]
MTTQPVLKCFVCFRFLSDVTAGAGESTTSCQPRAPHSKHGPKLPADWQEAKPVGNDAQSCRSSKLKNASNSGQRVASRPAPPSNYIQTVHIPTV